MKRVFIGWLLISGLLSCHKDVNNGTATTGPQITSATIINSMQPNTKIDGYMLDSGIISSPDGGTNLQLDYANVPAGMPWSDSLKIPANTVHYPTATYMTGVNQNLLGQTIIANEYF